MPLHLPSPEELQHKVDKHAKHQNSAPEDPLVLFRPPLHHPDRVSRNPHRSTDRIQLPLRPLQHLPLIAQIPQHSPAPLKVLIQSRVRRPKEILLPQRIILARLIRPQPVRRLVSRVTVRAALPSNEIGIRSPEQRVRVPRSARFHRRIGVWVLGRLARMGPATQEFRAIGGVPFLLFLVLELGEAGFEFEQFGAEVGDALRAFGRFVGDELDVDGALVVVECAGEGG